MTPRLADRHDVRDYLADAAVHLLRQRQASYPALIARDRMTSDEAARKCALASAVADQWRWVIDPARPPLPEWNDATGRFGAHDWDLHDEMVAAAKRARDIARRHPAGQPGEWEARELADLYEALAWWQQLHRGDALIIHDADLERRSNGHPHLAEAA
ncbi:MAG: hypothetical protein OSB00_07730 [Sphingomonas bacterium]|nr:hypothetical protein [Sphingomonas bacterium]